MFINYLANYLLNCSKFCGLIYLNYDPKTRRMVDSRMYSLAFVTGIAILTAFSSHALYRHEIAGTNHTITKITPTYTFETVSHTIVLVGIYSSVICKRRQCKMIMNLGLQMYEDVLKLDEPGFLKTDRKFIFCFIYTTVFGSFSLFSISIDYTMSPKFVTEEHWIKLLVSLNFVLISFIYALAVFIFVGVMLFAAHSLRLVNSKVQKCLILILKNPKMSECCKLSDELDELQHIHSRIMHFTQQVNTFYSISLLLKFLMRFIAAVSEVRICIQNWLNLDYDLI